MSTRGDMGVMPEAVSIAVDSEHAGRIRLAGDWRLDRCEELSEATADAPASAAGIDARPIERLDSAGAWYLLGLAERWGIDPADIELKDSHRPLIDTVARALASDETREPPEVPPWAQLLAGVGRKTAGVGSHARVLVGFLGLSMARLAATIWRPREWRLTATAFHIQQTGLNALGLVCLLAFMVGAVVAYLGATVLKEFGAELFVVDLITFSFLREFGVLLTAIILAGRTASAFTAQIGTMKSREEIDAMRTLGLDPVVLLVLPRLIAMTLVLPVLGAAATVAGFAGGLIICWTVLDIPPDLFFQRMESTLHIEHYLVGLFKAPLFAAVIALIGCVEGFKVAGTAQSVGERTTSAVVQSIALVIIIDALAAVFFMEIGW